MFCLWSTVFSVLVLFHVIIVGQNSLTCFKLPAFQSPAATRQSFWNVGSDRLEPLDDCGPQVRYSSTPPHNPLLINTWCLMGLHVYMTVQWRVGIFCIETEYLTTNMISFHCLRPYLAWYVTVFLDWVPHWHSSNGCFCSWPCSVCESKSNSNFISIA